MLDPVPNAPSLDAWDHLAGDGVNSIDGSFQSRNPGWAPLDRRIPMP